jgi:hypothetical protein
VTCEGEQAEMRILVAFEENYRAYREMIAAGIRIFRPHAEVEITSFESLGERIEHFDPELVICGGHEATHQGVRLAWVELSVDPLQPSKVWVVGRYSERRNPTVEDLLVIIDEVEELIQTNSDLEGC